MMGRVLLSKCPLIEVLVDVVHEEIVPRRRESELIARI